MHRRPGVPAGMAIFALLQGSLLTAGSFTGGNVVVYRVGDGSAPLSSNATRIFLEERSTASGALVQSISLPIETVGANSRLTASGNAIADGALTLSYDGRFLFTTGYDAAVGDINPTMVPTPRVVARIDAAGVVDTTTRVPSSVTPIRGAASTNGVHLWVGLGAGGVVYTVLGATSQPLAITSGLSSVRVVGIPAWVGRQFAPQLYASSGAGTPALHQIGVGTPTSGGLVPTPVVESSSPYGFVLYDLDPAEPGPDVLYVANDTAGTGVVRYRRTGGVWALSATLGPGVRQLAGSLSGSDPLLFATTSTGLYRLVDVGASTPSSASAFLQIAVAPGNTAFRGVAMAPDPDLIFRDSFEVGVDSWSAASTDGGDLSVAAEAALDGTGLGMRGVVDDTTGLFVEDLLPADENRYRARFYFDPHDFDPGTAQNHLRTRLFIAFEEGPTRRLLAVVLRYRDGQYAVMGRARGDDNGQVNTPFVPITAEPHAIEVDWRRSSGPDASDGRFEMWIDGVSVATLAGLDNSLSAVDLVRLGALSVKSGAAGTMYWDEFVSRRLGYIGP